MSALPYSALIYNVRASKFSLMKSLLSTKNLFTKMGQTLFVGLLVGPALRRYPLVKRAAAAGRSNVRRACFAPSGSRLASDLGNSRIEVSAAATSEPGNAASASPLPPRLRPLFAITRKNKCKKRENSYSP